MVCKGFESLSFSLAYSNFPNLKGSYLGCRQVVRHRVLIPTFRRFESSHSKQTDARILVGFLVCLCTIRCLRTIQQGVRITGLEPVPFYKDNHLKVARLPFRQIRVRI